MNQVAEVQVGMSYVLDSSAQYRMGRIAGLWIGCAASGDGCACRLP